MLITNKMLEDIEVASRQLMARVMFISNINKLTESEGQLNTLILLQENLWHMQCLLLI